MKTNLNLLFTIIIAFFFMIQLGCKKEENLNPSCRITSPSANDSFPWGTIIYVTINASDEDGTIEKVEFYVDDLFIGDCDTPLYTSVLITEDFSIGKHTIKAIAYDNEKGATIHELNINILKYLVVKDSNDGREYNSMKIGNQWWMVENMKKITASGSYIYNNIGTNETIYGRLYQWDSAAKVCPQGWHLPTDNEWKKLEIFLGMSQAEVDNWGWRGTDQGDQLKIEADCAGGTNCGTSGIMALLGGYYDGLGAYAEEGSNAYFWTSSQKDANYGWYRKLDLNKSTVMADFSAKRNAYSVRCIKDD